MNSSPKQLWDYEQWWTHAHGYIWAFGIYCEWGKPLKMMQNEEKDHYDSSFHIFVYLVSSMHICSSLFLFCIWLLSNKAQNLFIRWQNDYQSIYYVWSCEKSDLWCHFVFEIIILIKRILNLSWCVPITYRMPV